MEFKSAGSKAGRGARSSAISSIELRLEGKLRDIASKSSASAFANRSSISSRLIMPLTKLPPRNFSNSKRAKRIS